MEAATAAPKAETPETETETQGQDPTAKQATTPEPKPSLTEKEQTQPKRESEYVILISRDGVRFDLATTGDHSITANGQAAARREFVGQNAGQIEKLLTDGNPDEKLFLAAVPKASWHPTEVRIERPEPRIVA